MKPILLPAALFLGALLWINADLFRVPFYEDGDFAANALQVQDSKHFANLLGNYSRWHFHHPGPAFFYAYAAGEAVLHDALHAVPAPFNAHLVTIILLNVLFLAAAVLVMRRYWPAPWFPALAFAAAAVAVGVVNHRIPGASFISVWAPYVLLGPFLLFSVAAVSLACGTIEDLPLAVLAALFLIHGHIAQPIFVGPVGLLALAGAWYHHRGELAATLKRHRFALALSGALVALAILPIALELIVDEPDNLDAVRKYLREHRGRQWPVGMALRYVASFAVFMPNPEEVLVNPASGGLWGALRQPFVLAFWGGFAAVAAVASFAARGRHPAHRFDKLLMAEMALVCLLFFFWGTRIGGPLYNFNGFFFFSVLWLALFLVAARLASVIPETWRRGAPAVAAVTAIGMLLLAPAFKNIIAGNTFPVRVAQALEPERSRPIALVFEGDLWPPVAGVASRMLRVGQPFCVMPAWGFMFGDKRACSDVAALPRVRFTHQPVKCEPPCERIALEDPQATVSVWQIPGQHLPVTFGPAEDLDVKLGFLPPEGDFAWTSREGEIHFVLAQDQTPSRAATLEIAGFGLEGRPVEIYLNGARVGSLDGYEPATRGDKSAQFEVPWSLLRPGKENVVKLFVAKAGPVGPDIRELGFAVKRVALSARP